jgi:SAM-dependent methyltransferase
MQWFEDDNFWRDFYVAMFPSERFAIAEEQTGQILALTQFGGQAVLDLCCGPGRHSVSFAQRGLKVTGVDRSKFLLARARERANAAGVEVEWIEEDIRRFERPEAFDLACSLFTSFGYFEDESENLAVLQNAYRSLAPGGVFIIDVLGKEQLARRWLSAICNKLEDGSLFLQQPEVCADWTRMRNAWVLIKEGHARSFAFEHTIYSGREMKDLLMRAGFTGVALYGNLEGGSYGLDANRLVAVARKS